jgi:hypothetical protein
MSYSAKPDVGEPARRLLVKLGESGKLQEQEVLAAREKGRTTKRKNAYLGFVAHLQQETFPAIGVGPLPSGRAKNSRRSSSPSLI